MHNFWSSLHQLRSLGVSLDKSSHQHSSQSEEREGSPSGGTKELWCAMQHRPRYTLAFKWGATNPTWLWIMFWCIPQYRETKKKLFTTRQKLMSSRGKKKFLHWVCGSVLCRARGVNECACHWWMLAGCPAAFQWNYLLKAEHTESGQVIRLPGQEMSRDSQRSPH